MSANFLQNEDQSPENKIDGDTNSAFAIDGPPASSGTTVAFNIHDDQEKRPNYVTGVPMVLTIVGLLLTAFCVGLVSSYQPLFL